MFDGEEAKYEFLGVLRLHKLYDVILADEEPKEGNVDKNIDAFAQLIQCLDDRSLSLVMSDAKDYSRKARKILRNHYIGKSKPRVLSLYTELTSLQKGHDEFITDYVLRAETAAASLKSAGDLSLIATLATLANDIRELKHATFLRHGRTPEVYCFPILLVFTLPHLYF